METRAGTVIPALALLDYIFDRNDKSEHITYLDNVVRIYPEMVGV